MYAAHIKEDGKEQSVKEHLVGVAEVCRIHGKKIGLEQTAQLIGKIHDMGKATQEFDQYLRYSVKHPEDRSQRGKIDHASTGAQFIFHKYESGDYFNKLTAQIIALTVASHHGGLIDCLDLHGHAAFEERMNRELKHLDEAQMIYDHECFALSSLEQDFSKAKLEISAMNQKIRNGHLRESFALHLVAKYLFSCLVDADRYDTYCFMAGKTAKQPTDNTVLWNELSGKLEKFVDALPSDTELNKERRKISNQCLLFAQQPTGIYRLNVPTGGGKTLSSLRFALNHAKERHKNRIFYIIPFTTIIDQSARDIRDILQHDDAILEHHSNVVRDNNLEEYTLLTERWDTPIIFTTMVQFLNTLFEGGTQSVRRMHNLANSILIFDEIQALPLKCIHMFNEALNFLCSVCDTTSVLCTATQPLLGITKKALMYSEKPDIVSVEECRKPVFQRVIVRYEQIAGGYSEEDLADFVLAKLQSLNSMLVILNTKKTAANVYKTLQKINEELPEQEQYTIFHLSTSMCPSHRKKVLGELKELLNLKKKVICVSTQLIEAGINISMDCVIRALAGLDSIAQAAGRCNRHGEIFLREVYIVNMRNEFLEKLPEIKAAQECTKNVLHEYKLNPQKFNNNLLSQEAVERYYQYYFHQCKDSMNYNLSKKHTGIEANMYDLLNQNEFGKQTFYGLTGKESPFILNQSFHSAGELFEVIDQNTTSVLVPYGKGIELIEKINGNCKLEDLKMYIRQAQQYSVNLFTEDRKILEGKEGIYPLLNGGVLALQPEFYNEIIGVSLNGEKMQACFM